MTPSDCRITIRKQFEIHESFEADERHAYALADNRLYELAGMRGEQFVTTEVCCPAYSRLRAGQTGWWAEVVDQTGYWAIPPHLREAAQIFKPEQHHNHRARSRRKAA